MAYSGGMKKEFHGDENFAQKTFEVLIKCLLQVKEVEPFRGPRNFSEGDFSYQIHLLGARKVVLKSFLFNSHSDQIETSSLEGLDKIGNMLKNNQNLVVHIAVYKKNDKILAQKLAGELAGILAWAVRGCKEWRENGLGVPCAVSAATKEYREEQDEIGRFLAECCELDPDEYITKNLLHKEYEKWGGSLNKWRFGRQLKERGFDDDRLPGGIRTWQGIKLPIENIATPPEPNL